MDARIENYNDTYLISDDSHFTKWAKSGHFTTPFDNFSYIQQDDVVIDVGAYVGLYTRVFSNLVGKNGRVFAFEPHKLAYECLYLNTINLKNVWSWNIALGDKREVAYLNVNQPNYGASFLNYNPNDNLVDILYLDFFNFDPDFIKIDVEGFEFKVLQGSIKTIEKYRPIMYIEVCRQWLERNNTSPDEIYSFLHNLGYCIEGKNNLEQEDWLAIP